jgi:hypothetical protein
MRARVRALKPQYAIVLICPIGKIRLIWRYFETEPDMGSVWSAREVIRGHIEAGLNGLIGSVSLESNVPTVERGFKFGNLKY